MEDNDIIILNKLENLQKKVLEFLNAKLNINLTGKEIKIDLNNKNIGNIELNLLSCVEFKNLEEINLSNNNISDIEFLKDLNIPKLKKLDLSFNKIINSKNNNNKLSQNEFNNTKKDKDFLNKEIILDNNNLFAKDFEEIKKQIINNYQINNNIDNNNDIYDDEYNSFFMTSVKKSKNDNKKDLIMLLLNKLNKLENKVLEFLNVKLNINLTKEEIKIDLNNKNIGNIELNLLSSVEFNNLEEINLSNNNISDIEFVKDFNAPKLKKLDLSFNKISNISPLKDFAKINNRIEKINLNNNSINNIEILKSNIFPFMKEINLDSNNLIKKDIDEIKELISNNNLKNNNIQESNLEHIDNMNNIIIKFIDYIKIKDTIISTGLTIFLKKIFNNINNYNNIMMNNNNMNNFDMIFYHILFNFYDFKKNNYNPIICNMFYNNMNNMNNMNSMNNMNMMNMYNINMMNMNMMDENMIKMMNMYNMNNMNMMNPNNMNNLNNIDNMNIMTYIINIYNNMNINYNPNNFNNNMNIMIITYIMNWYINNYNMNNMNKMNTMNNIKIQMVDIIMRFYDYLKNNDIVISNTFYASQNDIDYMINDIINNISKIFNNNITNNIIRFPNFEILGNILPRGPQIIQADFYGNDENPKKNITIESTSGLKINMPTPPFITLKQLFVNYFTKIGINMNNLGDQIVFIYKAEKLNINDERKVDELLHNRDYDVITVFSKDIISA